MRDGQLGGRGGVRAPGKKRNRLGMNSVWRESSKAFFPGGCGFTSVSRTSCGFGGGVRKTNKTRRKQMKWIQVTTGTACLLMRICADSRRNKGVLCIRGLLCATLQPSGAALEGPLTPDLTQRTGRLNISSAKSCDEHFNHCQAHQTPGGSEIQS